jgi:hypothetical protein
MMALGAFPTTTLAEAREKRDHTRKLLASGIDPARQKKLDKLAASASAQNTFRALAEEYLANREASGAAETTMVKNRWMLLDLAAPLANRPIADILPIEVLDVLSWL